MSVADVTARIQQLQGELALLTPAQRATGSSAPFARALGDASLAPTWTASPVTTDSGATGGEVVAEARKYLGVPYVWGGTDPAKGLDCSGLVQLVYRNLGHELPRVSYQQATAGRPVTGGLAAAQPGDILAFGSPVHHVGIYAGDGMMIEAPRPGKDVRIAPVTETPTAIRRILPETAAQAPAPSVAVGRVPTGTPYADLFERAGQRHGVDPLLLVSVARQESGFNPKAVSHAGAQGLMQLMPGTAIGLGVADPFDPSQAIDGAAKLLRSLLDRFGGTDLALAAYNAGPSAVAKYQGIPPYPETRNYVSSILAQMEAAA